MKFYLLVILINAVFIGTIIFVNNKYREYKIVVITLKVSLCLVAADLFLGFFPIILIDYPKNYVMYLAMAAYLFFVIFVAIFVWDRLQINIKNDPPEIGIPTIWGKKDWEGMVGEGKRLYANFFPFYLNYVLVPIKKRNIDIDDFIEVWCLGAKNENGGPAKPQVKMGVKLSYTYAPDYYYPRRIAEDFINIGHDEGVKNNLLDIIKQQLKNAGLRMSWEDFYSAQYKLSLVLLCHLTNINEETSINDFCDLEETELREKIKNIPTEGKADHHGLGIRFFRINIKEIDILDEELKKTVTSISTEEKQRTAELYEIKTEIMQAKELKEEVPDLSFFDAWKIIKKYKLVKEGKIDGKMISVEGLGDLGKILNKIVK